MAIRFKNAHENGIEVEQFSNPPTVYLDNWTYNLFALSDRDLGRKFVAILNDRGGTLQISDINLIEIVRGKNITEFDAIVDLINEVDTAFIDSNPSRVIEREMAFKSGAGYGPCVDEVMLRSLFQFTEDFLSPFSVSDLLVKLRDDLEHGYNVNSSFSSITSTIERARQDDETLKRVVGRWRKRKSSFNKAKPPYTKFIWTCINDFIVGQQGMTLDDGEWMDVLHLVVPVAYSQFVTMDGRWAEFIKQSKVTFPDVAAVYGPNNIDQFLVDLKEFNVECLLGSWHAENSQIQKNRDRSPDIVVGNRSKGTQIPFTRAESGLYIPVQYRKGE